MLPNQQIVWFIVWNSSLLKFREKVDLLLTIRTLRYFIMSKIQKKKKRKKRTEPLVDLFGMKKKEK